VSGSGLNCRSPKMPMIAGFRQGDRARLLAADRSGPRFSLIIRRELGGNNSENFLSSRCRYRRSKEWRHRRTKKIVFKSWEFFNEY
jgi:hypothetical protein